MDENPKDARYLWMAFAVIWGVVLGTAIIAIWAA